MKRFADALMKTMIVYGLVILTVVISMTFLEGVETLLGR